MTQLRTGDANLDNGHLASFVERLEKLAEEKAAVAEDFKEVMSEAKGSGLCIKTIRTVLKIRKMDKAKRAEEEELLSLYLTSLGLE